MKNEPAGGNGRALPDDERGRLLFECANCLDGRLARVNVLPLAFTLDVIQIVSDEIQRHVGMLRDSAPEIPVSDLNRLISLLSAVSQAVEDKAEIYGECWRKINSLRLQRVA